MAFPQRPRLLFTCCTCPTVPQAGMALGGAGAALALGPTAAVVAGGASVGAALGLLGHVATNRPAEKEPNKMIYEM